MWILVNIGCIECGVSSNIVGVYDSEKQANELAQILSNKADWREGGQNSFEVFELPEVGVMADEYKDYLA